MNQDDSMTATLSQVNAFLQSRRTREKRSYRLPKSRELETMIKHGLWEANGICEWALDDEGRHVIVNTTTFECRFPKSKKEKAVFRSVPADRS